ncbi:MAG: hypothetical protein IPM91_02825 [Bacteroidetes bacterium]|nr:hypothetical protein [Bacteroidota bacterium]
MHLVIWVWFGQVVAIRNHHHGKDLHLESATIKRMIFLPDTSPKQETQKLLLDNYMEQLNGVDPDDIPSFYPFDIDLAWQTYLIDTIDDAGTPYYYSALPFAGALQRKTVETRGGQGEWDFTFGGNYEDMFFFGLTLGVTTLRYFEESTWEERDDQDTIPYFESYQYNQTLETSGSGINVKAGFIFKPADAFRLGLAIHSPTWHSLVDEYSTSIKTDLEDGVIRDYTGPVFVPFDYNITTPFRVITSMGIIIGKQMAFNVDYEFLDYSQGRIRPVNRSFASDFTPVNKAMRSKYTASHNLRAGLEWRFEQLRFRAGGYYSTSPFESALRISDDTDLSRYGITGDWVLERKILCRSGLCMVKIRFLLTSLLSEQSNH